jgi:(p)ppGpp synthase/HD superfamily hydrolase
VATILAQMRIDAVGVVAGVIFEVVLLKFAYRLHTMRIIIQHMHQPSPLPFDQQEMLTMAQETRDIYAPWPDGWVCRASSVNWKT